MQIHTWTKPTERMTAPEGPCYNTQEGYLKADRLRTLAKALDKVSGRLDAIAEQYGYSSDFADTVIRFANATGCATIVMPDQTVGVPPGGARFFLEALRDSQLASE